MPEEKVGLEAIFETEGFTKGVETYKKGLSFVDNLTTGFAQGVGQAAFKAISEGFNTIVGGAIDLSKSMIENVGLLQQMSIALDSLAAKEILQAGITDDMATAFRLGEARADEMLKKIKDLSLESPFEYKDIVDTYRMAQAFGISSDLALEVTGAITNMTAGMGLSSQMMNRLIYNFGQMNRIGKISQRDVRDLAMAGLDLADVLEQKLNKSIKETNEALAAGEISFDDVTKALIDYSNTFFGGAAEKASRTLPGLISSFHDLLFFASMDVWGPATEAVTGFLGKVFDEARRIIDDGALKKIGAALKVLADIGIEMADEALPKVVDFFDSMGTEADNTATEAFGWGLNIIFEFAAGIVEGIETVLVGAMNFLTSILSFFMSPGSPPRVAPDIDVWGTSLINEYIKGMTQADFSAINAIQGPLKNAIENAVAAGMIGEEAGIDLFKSLSKDLAKLLSGKGGDLSDIIRDITSIGPMGDELAALVQAQFEFVDATNAATAAQDELTAAKKRSEDADQNLNAQVAKYNQLLRSGASKGELDNQLKLIKAAELEEAASLAAIKTGEEKVNTTKAAADLMKEQFQLQKSMFEELLQLSETVFVPETPKTTGGGGGGGDKKKGGGLSLGTLTKEQIEASWGVFGEMPPGMDEALDFGARFRKQLEDIAKKIEGPITDITTSFDNVKKAWNELTIALGLGPDPMEASWGVYGELPPESPFGILGTWAKDGTLRDIGTGLTLVAAGFTALSIISSIGATIVTVGGPIITFFKGLGTVLGVISVITGVSVGWIIAIGVAIAALAYILITNWDDIKIAWGEFVVAIGEWWKTYSADAAEQWADFKKLAGETWNDITKWFEGIWKDITGDFDQAKKDWKTTTDEWGKDAKQAWTDFQTALSTFATEFGQKLTDFGTNLGTELGNWGTAIGNFVTVTIPGWFADMKTAGSDLLQGFWDGLTEKWGEVIKWIIDIAGDLIEAIRKEFDEHSESKVMFEIGQNFTKGFKLGMIDSAKDLEKAAGKAFSPTIGAAFPAQQFATQNVYNYNMGGNRVSQNIDIAVLEATIDRVIRRTVKG